MKTLDINLKDNSYQIIIADHLLDNLSSHIEKVYHNKKIYVVTDDNVSKLYLDKVVNGLKDKYEVDYIIIKAGESSKSLTTYASLCEELIDKGIKRNNLLIALGGGVVGDLVGFVASTLYRGIPFINIPTSLLSQTDSSIGGKTGVDFKEHKNILGTFKQPLLVLIDPITLSTLAGDEFASGLGEVIKHGAIGNVKLLEELTNKHPIDEDIILESLKVKKSVVEKDVFDQKERMLLNFGHTFGHIIELKYNYKHGQAVGIGMLMAIKMGIDLNITNPDCYKKIKAILLNNGLPVDEYDYKKYLDEVVYDKKNLAGTINFILLKDLGEAIIYPLDSDKLACLK